jgi:hypothetical protein
MVQALQRETLNVDGVTGHIQLGHLPTTRPETFVARGQTFKQDPAFNLVLHRPDDSRICGPIRLTGH